MKNKFKQCTHDGQHFSQSTTNDLLPSPNINNNKCFIVNQWSPCEQNNHIINLHTLYNVDYNNLCKI